MQEIFGQHGLTLTAIEAVEGSELEQALARTFSARTELLVVLGGDGTIRAAAESAMVSDGLLLPLPGGTMNLLPRALYGEGRWDEVLSNTLQSPSFVDVSGATVEGRSFFCAGIFGSPALWSDAREAIRDNHLIAAISAASKAFKRAFARKLRFRSDMGQTTTATAISIICPLFSQRLPSGEASFEVAALDLEGITDALHLAWTSLVANWRNDQKVTSMPAKIVELRAGQSIPAILDGEKVILPSRCTVRFQNRCFRAVVPSLT